MSGLHVGDNLVVSNDFYELLQDASGKQNRVAQVLMTYHPGNIPLRNAREANFIKLSGENLSYLPMKNAEAFRAKDHRNFNPFFNANGRQESKAARLARRLIVNDFGDFFLHDKDFESFSNIVKAYVMNQIGTYALVDGEEIRHWYDGAYYEERTASLMSSCMRYSVCAPYFDIYVDHPEFVKMLVSVNGDRRLLGRALIWTMPDGKIILDRVYGSDSSVEAFRTYAREQGWWVRSYNTFEHETYFTSPTGVKEVILYTLPLSKLYRTYPYMDTFKYLNMKNKTITNDPNAQYDMTLMGIHGDDHYPRGQRRRGNNGDLTMRAPAIPNDAIPIENVPAGGYVDWAVTTDPGRIRREVGVEPVWHSTDAADTAPPTRNPLTTPITIEEVRQSMAAARTQRQFRPVTIEASSTGTTFTHRAVVEPAGRNLLSYAEALDSWNQNADRASTFTSIDT